MNMGYDRNILYAASGAIVPNMSRLLAFLALCVSMCLAGAARATVALSPSTIDFGLQPGSTFGNNAPPADAHLLFPPYWWSSPLDGEGGTTDVRSVAFTNTGTTTVNILNVEADGVSFYHMCPYGFWCQREAPIIECTNQVMLFFPNSLPITIAPGESCRFSVYHISEGIGPLTASLRFVTDDPSSPHVVDITALRRTGRFIADVHPAGQPVLVQVGVNDCLMTGAEWLSAPGTGTVPGGSFPPGAAFPYGVFRYEAMPCTPSVSQAVTLRFSVPVSPRTKVFMYAPKAAGEALQWMEVPATISDREITLQVTNDAAGDADPQNPGKIVAYIALALTAPPAAIAPIPSLTWPAMALMSCALLLLGMGRVVRQRSG